MKFKVEEGIVLIIGIIIVATMWAYTMPGVFTTLSTVAYTSVNAGIVSMNQLVFPLVIVAGVILWLVRSAMAS